MVDGKSFHILYLLWRCPDSRIMPFDCSTVSRRQSIFCHCIALWHDCQNGFFCYQNAKKEVLIALAGPLSNGVMLTVSLFAGLAYDTLNTTLFAVINFAMLILNLLPVPPLDGGRILRAIIMSRTGLIPAGRLMRRISIFFIAAILITGIFLLVFFRGNPSLVMIGAFLLYSFFNEKKNSDILVMHEISHEKEKLSTSSFIPTKVLCVHADTPAKKILKK